MDQAFKAAAALLMTTTLASAGGLDRSGQSIGVIFEDGDYVELSFGRVTPDVSGTTHAALGGGALGGIDSGNMGAGYNRVSGALKMDVNDQLSFALILDEPFGANVDYAEPTYPLGVSSAEINSTGITALANYQINENFSVHGGIRNVSMNAEATLFVGSTIGLPQYDVNVENGSATGFVVGAAYERPDIALRVALTYASELDFSLDTQTSLGGAPLADVANTEFTMPQSVNLEFQTGIAEGTLLFGSMRWAEWTNTTINTVGYPAPPLVSHDNDTYSWTLGVGRSLTDRLSAAVTVGYEASHGGIAANLSPTDGYSNISLGGSYQVTDQVKVTGGISFIQIGDATTSIAEFSDNTAVGVGLRVGYSF